jgi:hypothetical protein
MPKMETKIRKEQQREGREWEKTEKGMWQDM